MSDTDMGIQLPPEQAGKVAAWQAEIDEKRVVMMRLVERLAVGDAREVRKALNALPGAAEDYAITRLVHQELIVNTCLTYGKPGPVKIPAELVDRCPLCSRPVMSVPPDARPSNAVGSEHQDCTFPNRGARWVV